MGYARYGIVVLGLIVLALAPVSAYAEDGNQAAIEALRAEKGSLSNLSPMQQGVMFGQQQIGNARAIASLLYWDGHAQTEIPNSMQQYTAFCSAALDKVRGDVANATAMAMARPWDGHAQAELANANAVQQSLWMVIGESYPGNPYAPAVEVYAADEVVLADDGAQSLVADSDADGGAN
ncbi:MAG TPA: hypothetical protein VGQ62_22125 [Chloroflexota bacterium]|jgi:hypothetical protein|nr:hypothetical protein [Chloroflexota bacterium]